ncbi:MULTISPECIES: hypothetical protein [Dehalobacter]|uniref:Uncharacterized protein n=1 Tax=Dehalobacter restrictus TaxID=55583 RepID=A0A857DI18_9FIRM|nr:MULTISPECIES: hypothetical protein [Dehalobacter]MCG1025927.1 hypothetical protein [Dehalobacter sp.]OCZ52047.1 hypothetical protein A7D23_11415 [Dehalobacter sp. TeCB1]QGZ99974.1 hypothetical protein GQ588_04595 [Dehalobacter restrictus]
MRGKRKDIPTDIEMGFINTVHDLFRLYSNCDKNLENGVEMKIIIGKLKQGRFADTTTKLKKLIKEIEENE